MSLIMMECRGNCKNILDCMVMKWDPMVSNICMRHGLGTTCHTTVHKCVLLILTAQKYCSKEGRKEDGKDGPKESNQ